MHITEPAGEYFRYDEDSRRRAAWASAAACAGAIGSRVRVQVSRVDLDSRRIDLRIVRGRRRGRARGAWSQAGFVARACDRLAALRESQGARDREVKKARAKVAVARSAGVKRRRRESGQQAAVADGVWGSVAAMASIRSAARKGRCSCLAQPLRPTPPPGRLGGKASWARRVGWADHRPPIHPASTSPVPAVAVARYRSS